VPPPSFDGLRGARADATILALAGRQHGVVTRARLLRAGIGPDVIDRRITSGLLFVLHRGVYRVGPVAAPRSREMAAALAYGASARVCLRSAASLWSCLPERAADTPVDIIAAGRRPSRPGIRVHRDPGLRPDEVTTLDGIPTTTPARTLYDLAAVATHDELESALAEAFARALVTRADLETLLARHGSRRGTARLRSLLTREELPGRMRSKAEVAFQRLLRRARFPRPRVNMTVAGHRLDCHWPDLRLAVEIDGYAFHGSRRSFESDRKRDRALAAAGLLVIRFTWSQIIDEPEATLVEFTDVFRARQRELRDAGSVDQRPMPVADRPAR
jgi:very-short-patch-repair endonuclease